MWGRVCPKHELCALDDITPPPLQEQNQNLWKTVTLKSAWGTVNSAGERSLTINSVWGNVSKSLVSGMFWTHICRSKGTAFPQTGCQSRSIRGGQVQDHSGRSVLHRALHSGSTQTRSTARHQADHTLLNMHIYAWTGTEMGGARNRRHKKVKTQQRDHGSLRKVEEKRNQNCSDPTFISKTVGQQ